MKVENKLYIVLISIHGLVRATNIELGRDADTGGQVKYVIELAKALGRHEQVGRVDLLTRQIIDPQVDSNYSISQEKISPTVHIIRLPCGPVCYLRKESLWPYLDTFADHALQYFRKLGRLPEVIHGHYADAGYVGKLLATVLAVPLVFTAHSLGRVKQQKLLEKGLTEGQISQTYRIEQRIEAEEQVLDNATIVVASTYQEANEQYGQYTHANASKPVVIPPGVELDRFYPPSCQQLQANDLYPKLLCFLTQPDKPIILALSRPDERKNIPALIAAYGQTPALRQLANLVIIAGNRDDLKTMPVGVRTVLEEILYAIDKYELYGQVAYPKQHTPDEVPEFYRLAMASGGIFVNPALTEPFGLTLLEAAASGLPIVSTHDGGPIDIIKHCQNGLLVDPLCTKTIGDVLLAALSDQQRWQQWSQNGINGVKNHYSWDQHVQTYLAYVNQILLKKRRNHIVFSHKPSLTKRVFITDIDNSLVGDIRALYNLLDYLHDENILFGIATGRSLESTLEILQAWNISMPKFFITNVGSEIYYGPELIADASWQKHIHYRWAPQNIQAVLASLPELELQPTEHQNLYKLSYFVKGKPEIIRSIVARRLRQHKLVANIIYSHYRYLDILPIRASKGLAVRAVALKLNLRLDDFLIVGNSGNDEDMLRGAARSVIVGNYSTELEGLKHQHNSQIYFAEAYHARGILEGIRHFNWLVDKPRELKEKPKELSNLVMPSPPSDWTHQYLL